MEKYLNAGQLLLLVVLTLMQLARWTQKTEDGSSEAKRIAKEALTKANECFEALRKHKHAWYEFRNNRFSELDITYARKREIELELAAIRDRVDADCDRITSVEQMVRKLTGV